MELDGKRGRVPERRVRSQSTFFEVGGSLRAARRLTLGVMDASPDSRHRPNGARSAPILARVGQE
jgi:hypothetical protein